MIDRVRGALRRLAPRAAVLLAFAGLAWFAIDAQRQLDECQGGLAACRADLAPQRERVSKLFESMEQKNRVTSITEINRLGAFLREKGKPCPMAESAYRIESHPDGSVVRVVCRTSYRIVRIPALGVERVEDVPESE